MTEAMRKDRLAIDARYRASNRKKTAEYGAAWYQRNKFTRRLQTNIARNNRMNRRDEEVLHGNTEAQA